MTPLVPPTLVCALTTVEIYILVERFFSLFFFLEPLCAFGFLRKSSFWKIPTQFQLNKRKKGFFHKGLWVARGDLEPLPWLTLV